MSTRSFIGKLNSDDTITGIYCHYDGYPENQEPILHQYYNNLDLVNELISLGSLSYLGSLIGEEQDFNNPTSSDWCLAYHRDRKEKLDIRNFSSLDDMFYNIGWANYAYLFKDNNWETYKYFSSMGWKKIK